MNSVLLVGEFSFYIALVKLANRSIKNVAKFIGLVNKEITTEGVAVMLDNNIVITLAIEGAVGMPAASKIVQHRIYDAYAEFFGAII